MCIRYYKVFLKAKTKSTERYAKGCKAWTDKYKLSLHAISKNSNCCIFPASLGLFVYVKDPKGRKVVVDFLARRLLNGSVGPTSHIAGEIRTTNLSH